MKLTLTPIAACIGFGALLCYDLELTLELLIGGAVLFVLALWFLNVDCRD